MESVEVRLGSYQRSQHGLVSHAQAHRAGVSRRSLRKKVAAGALVEMFGGVYAPCGTPLTRDQQALAAVLAGGETAFASHALAAALWDLPLPEQLREPGIEITTVLERHPRIEGVTVHRSGLLADVDVTRLRGIPIATPERVAADLSSRLSIAELGKLVDDAVRRRLTTIWRVRRTASRLPRAPGRSPKKLEEMLRRRVPGTEDRESVLEDFVFDALRRFRLRLPTPQHRVEIGGQARRIDHCYVEERVAIEALGFGPHSQRAVFDDDALRGNQLVLAGFKVLEFTSAFTDWQIAVQVAEALGEPQPPRPTDELAFSRWLETR